jgi:hypothetical protein
MVYSTQNYRRLGLFPSSGLLENRNTTFRKIDLFPSSGEGGEDPSSTHVRVLLQFLLNIFLLSPAELAWYQVIK